MSFYDEGRACVRVENVISESFEVNMGLRQGCVKSPWMFNMFMDGVVREVYSRALSGAIQITREVICNYFWR